MEGIRFMHLIVGIGLGILKLRKFRPEKGVSQMEWKSVASAGTLESSDIFVVIDKGLGIEIDLDSTVEKQYGARIREVIVQTLRHLGADNVKVTAKDRGALDCTIAARVSAAWYRAAGSTDYRWGDQDGI
jgi:citrate lyase subunit gamma (acyl carrier protein)